MQVTNKIAYQRKVPLPIMRLGQFMRLGQSLSGSNPQWEAEAINPLNKPNPSKIAQRAASVHSSIDLLVSNQISRKIRLLRASNRNTLQTNASEESQHPKVCSAHGWFKFPPCSRNQEGCILMKCKDKQPTEPAIANWKVRNHGLLLTNNALSNAANANQSR